MSILKEYEERMKLEPLTPVEVEKRLDHAAAWLSRPPSAPMAGDEFRDNAARVILWLGERLEALTSKVPTETRCLWCLDAAGRTDEALLTLPAMSLDDVKEHVRVCPHNPLVKDLHELRDTLIGLAMDEVATSGEMRKRILELAGLLQ